VSAAAPHKWRPWVLAAALVGLIGGPVVLYYLLPAAGASAAVASGAALIVALKHLGLLAALVTPFALFRRRSRDRRDER
jgi:uncharacterized membrane protein YhaH (DUF805 family)